MRGAAPEVETLACLVCGEAPQICGHTPHVALVGDWAQDFASLPPGRRVSWLRKNERAIRAAAPGRALRVRLEDVLYRGGR